MLPDGNLWEVTPAGTLVHQVAIGYPNASMSAWRPTATGSFTWLATTSTFRRTGTRRPSWPPG